MPDSQKAKDKAKTEDAAQPTADDEPQGEQTEKDAATEAPASLLPGQVTLSKARLEELRRRLKMKYH